MSGQELTGRRIGSGGAELPESVDVLVVGLGVTGAGVSLDAVTRGLSTLAVDAHDLAFGTSRWSSKLVHGGLRYLASGQVGIAQESAVERGILMRTTAPHLTHALPMLLPLTSGIDRRAEAWARAGFRAGDLLRMAARTPRSLLPAPRRVSAIEALTYAPGLARDLRGGLLSFDGQLEDDARLVINLARTAASYGAQVRTYLRVLTTGADGVRLRDEATGSVHHVRARIVVNAAGVWAGQLSERLTLRPSRGTHLVLRSEALGDPRAAITAPVPGESTRFVFALPQPEGLVYLGLTDEATETIEDVPTPTQQERRFLLDTINGVLARPLTEADVVGGYAGLRPLLSAQGSTADLSRRHAVIEEPGMVSIVGGKLTTYRRMAQDAVDAAAIAGRLDAGPCRTATLSLLGAAPRRELRQDTRLGRRFGADAERVLSCARETTGLTEDELTAAGPGGVTLAELVFGVTDEGAQSVADLLERRTRVALDATQREPARRLAERALSLTGIGS